jgi:probable phosphoglycerate mutase
LPADEVIVWYIRHGENPANLTGEMSCRRVDYPLTERGVTQARDLARSLAGEAAPAAIYASPLRRAAQTAQVIAAGAGVAVVTVEELREVDVGDLEGRCDEQAWAAYLEVYSAWRAGDLGRAFPGGENYHQLSARLAAALRRTLAHPPGSRVLVVAHDGIIRAGLPSVCPGQPPPAAGLPHCGVARLALRAAGPRGIEGTLLEWPAMR